MDRFDDDKNTQIFFQNSRFKTRDGKIYYRTREGATRGPFKTPEAAKRDLRMYIFARK